MAGTNIVDQLRIIYRNHPIAMRAADEIERLREDRDMIARADQCHLEEIAGLREEIGRLRSGGS